MVVQNLLSFTFPQIQITFSPHPVKMKLQIPHKIQLCVYDYGCACECVHGSVSAINMRRFNPFIVPVNYGGLNNFEFLPLFQFMVKIATHFVFNLSVVNFKPIRKFIPLFLIVEWVGSEKRGVGEWGFGTKMLYFVLIAHKLGCVLCKCNVQVLFIYKTQHQHMEAHILLTHFFYS